MILFRNSKCLLLTLFCGVYFILPLASQQNTDSLVSALAQSGQDTNRVKTLNRLSWTMRSVDPAQAMIYAEEAKSLSEKLGYERGRGDSYNYIGVILYRRGEYAEAAEAHFQALTIREKIGDKEGTALSYINLGNVYSDQNNNTLALDHYLKAANILYEIDDTKRLPTVYLNISAIFLAEHKYDEGLSYCEKARKSAIENKDQSIEAQALNNIGVVYESQNRFEEALKMYSSSYEISLAIDDQTEMVDNMTNIGNMHRLLKNPTLALDWHKKTEKLAREIGYLEGLRVLYGDFSKDYQATGQFEKALDYQIHFKTLSDSLFNDENTSRINALTDKWQKDRDEKELLKKQQDLLQQKETETDSGQRLWVITGGSILLILFGSYVLYANAQLKRAKITISTKVSELERLKKIQKINQLQ